MGIVQSPIGIGSLERLVRLREVPRRLARRIARPRWPRPPTAPQWRRPHGGGLGPRKNLRRTRPPYAGACCRLRRARPYWTRRPITLGLPPPCCRNRPHDATVSVRASPAPGVRRLSGLFWGECCHRGNGHSAATTPDYGHEPDTGRGAPLIPTTNRARCTVARPQRPTARTLAPAARRRRISPSRAARFSAAPVARSCPRFQPARFPPGHKRPSSAGSASPVEDGRTDGTSSRERSTRTAPRRRRPGASRPRGPALAADDRAVRFSAAARAAGLERRVTAHSGRVGLASELTTRGASTTDVMLAGNWKTSRMVAHYSAGATAERGAVARYL